MSIIEQVGEVPDRDVWDEAEPFDSEAAEDEAGPSTVAEFDGDAGGLTPEERRALVVLLKNPFITSESHPREWKTVVGSRAGIGQRLNDLYLTLEVNHEREVAYKRPATSETGSRVFPTLLYNAAWQREETALLVYLRVRERNERARGEARVRVSRSEMLEHLREHRPDSATNQAADDKRAGRAIDTIKGTGLLTKTDEGGVYGISPAIEPMMPMPTLTNLLTWLTERMSTEEEMS